MASQVFSLLIHGSYYLAGSKQFISFWSSLCDVLADALMAALQRVIEDDFEFESEGGLCMLNTLHCDLSLDDWSFVGRSAWA